MEGRYTASSGAIPRGTGMAAEASTITLAACGAKQKTRRFGPM